MAEPREYLIVQNLQAALLAITVAGGYHYDVAALAVKLDPNHGVEALIGPQKKRPFYVIELNPDAFAYSPSKLVTVTMPIRLHAVHDSDPTDDNSWLLTYLRLCADLEQAIAVDIQRGGLAIDTRIVSREFRVYDDDTALVWASAAIEIPVRRLYGTPNG